MWASHNFIGQCQSLLLVHLSRDHDRLAGLPALLHLDLEHRAGARAALGHARPHEHVGDDPVGERYVHRYALADGRLVPVFARSDARSNVPTDRQRAARTAAAIHQ